MNHGALFNGIGGFQLAAQWMGWNNVFCSEIDEFCNKVTKYHFPNCIQHHDIKQTDFTIYRGRVDIVTGGFPCQPYSAAGKRKGTDDDRHLWLHMHRAIREIQPAYVVGENVRGFTNWNGGMVFDQVQADLEAEGYEVAPFLLPACAVNAPHRRDRIWIVAYSRHYAERQAGNSNTDERKEFTTLYEEGQEGNSEAILNNRLCNLQGTTPDTSNKGLQGSDKTGNIRQEKKERINEQLAGQYKRNNWQNFPTQSPIHSGDDGLSDRLDGITFSKWRNESIKAYGNAIVPQVALEIFKAISNYPDIKK